MPSNEQDPRTEEESAGHPLDLNKETIQDIVTDGDADQIKGGAIGTDSVPRLNTAHCVSTGCAVKPGGILQSI